MLIDFHTHIFPEKIARKTLEVLKAGAMQYEKKEICSYFDGTLSGLLLSMNENDVDVSVALPIATKPSQTESINSYAKSVTNSKIISFASLHPLNDNIAEILENIKSAGFSGIKLHPEFQKFNVDSPEAIKIFKKAEELELYTILHTGHDIGLPPPVHSTPKMLKNILDYVSGKYVIAAHLGGWRMWDDVEKYLVGTQILFDTAFISDYIPKDQCVRIIKNHGCDKILFGSDNPWESPTTTLEFLRSLDLEKTELENITHKNALKILNV